MHNDSNEENKEEGPRSFTAFLRDLAEGEAEADLSYQLHQLCLQMQEEAVARSCKVKGELVLKVNLVADHKDNVNVAYTVDVKPPARRTSGAIYWLTKGGNLTPENPRQQKLPLREVPRAAREVREVGSGGATEARKV